MPQNIWNQKSTQLLDVPSADDGSKYGQPGEVLAVNESRDGFVWQQGGGSGSQGPEGPAGPANTLTIGTVVDGENADATIVGNSPNQTLNLVLPRGADGANGIGEAPQDGTPYSRQDEAWVPAPILDETGHIPLEQVPPSLVGQREFISLWDASTNTPAIPAASTENQGRYYVVSVAGNTEIDGESGWQVGDTVISNGTVWSKLGSSTGGVQVVNGKTGAVVGLVASDIPGISAVGKTGQYSDLLGTPKRVYNLSASGLFQAQPGIGTIIADRNITFNTGTASAKLFRYPTQSTPVTGKLTYAGVDYTWTIPAGSNIGAFDSAVDITITSGNVLMWFVSTSILSQTTLGLMLKEV